MTRIAPIAQPSALALAAALLLGPLTAAAQTLPSGMSVQAGQASSQLNGNTLTIRNSSGTILNWDNFSIGAQNAVRFEQPNAQSVVLNRVTGPDPSSLLGSLGSNGKVWLVNPNGVFFGAQARVDVSALVASTLPLSDRSWLDAQGGSALILDRASTTPAATISNVGTLRSSSGGQIVLLGATVRNDGVIDAPGGQVLLAAGDHIELIDSHTPHMSVRLGTTPGQILNSGTLAAAGGSIELQAAAINQSGIIRADALQQGDGGRIVLRASRSLDVSAASQTSADGAGQGNGGSIVLWSDTSARILGSLSARAGLVGNGGFIETSAGWIDLHPSRLDVSATQGRAGTWLIDPHDVYISDTLPANFDPSTTTWIETFVIEQQIHAGTSVSISTTGPSQTGVSTAGDLTISNARMSVPTITSGLGSLTLQADHNLVIDQSTLAGNALILAAAGGLQISNSDLHAAGQVQLRASSVSLSQATSSQQIITTFAPGDAILIAGLGDTEPLSTFSNTATFVPFSTSQGRWVIYAASDAPAVFNPGNLAGFPTSGASTGTLNNAAFGAWKTVSGNVFAFAPPAVTVSPPTPLPQQPAPVPPVTDPPVTTPVTPGNPATSPSTPKFPAAVNQLTQNPNLPDLGGCRSSQEAAEGQCLVTDALREQEKAQRALMLPRPAPTLPGLRQRVRAAALPQIQRKVALVIGVERYLDPAIYALPGAGQDTRALARLLDEHLGYEVVRLDNPSRRGVVAALNRLAIELEPSDSLLIYYAGHGELLPATGHGYWLLGDSRADDPAGWLSNVDIDRLISRIDAAQVALISDSCYSGALLAPERIHARPERPDPAALLARKAVVVMSSGANEPVADQGRDGYSLFAWSLMQALQQVSTWQPGGNLFEHVRYRVARELPQRPQYGPSRAGHQSGSDYVFEQRQLEAER